MDDDLFHAGGPYDVQKTGQHEFAFKIPVEPDQEGRVARACPDDCCSPGYFKVRLGTGITHAQETAYCPYCRREGEPSSFMTREQLRYGKEVVIREAHAGMHRMLKGALGLGSTGTRKFGGGMVSMEMSFKPGRPPSVQRPFEDEVRRGVACPNCGLDHAVFGFALWCPDCGQDIFMTHVDAEYSVVRTMLDDVDRRRKQFGARVAARDLENCLEDTVSVFEATLKAFVRRRLRSLGESDETIEEVLQKRVRNSFQNIERAQGVAREYVGVELFEALSADEVCALRVVFEKRHPITHNLGVIDRKYMERAMQAEQEGRDILVTADEINDAVSFCQKVLNGTHLRIFEPN